MRVCFRPTHTHATHKQTLNNTANTTNNITRNTVNDTLTSNGRCVMMPLSSVAPDRAPSSPSNSVTGVVLSPYSVSANRPRISVENDRFCVCAGVWHWTVSFSAVFARKDVQLWTPIITEWNTIECDESMSWANDVFGNKVNSNRFDYEKNKNWIRKNIFQTTKNQYWRNY